MVHIKKKNSVFAHIGDAFSFNAPAPDTLIVDKDAFLKSDWPSGAGARLLGAWTVTIDGKVQSFGGDDIAYGLQISATSSLDVMKLAIGTTGLISGGKIALATSEAGTLNNKGRIIGAFVAAELNTVNGDVTVINKGTIKGGSDAALRAIGDGVFALNNSGLITNPERSFATAPTVTSTVTNWGTMQGGIILGDSADTFTNFKKVGQKVISGTLAGQIDMRDGADTFNGGAKSEIVNGGLGDDIVKLGSGNDSFQVFFDDGADTVNAGRGIDTYDIRATELGAVFIVNLDSVVHATDLPPNMAVDVFANTLDSIIGFENVMGGLGTDVVYGSAGANVIRTSAGIDSLYGLGGRDVLEGGGDADTFYFTKLGDSRVAANQRDLILDFVTGEDKIDLVEIDANTKLAGNDAFHLTGNGGFGKFTHDPGQLRFQYDHGKTIVSGDVNGDAKADFSILLKGKIVFDVVNDFVL